MATFEKLENNKVKVTVEISADVFDDALQNAYLKTKSRFNVPGFRKGKAPRRMIESMYGEGIFLEDAFELVYGAAYDKAIEELQLEPVERPDLSIEKIGQGEGVVFTAEFAVRPEVKLGKYKGVEVTKRSYPVEESEIDTLIEQEREKVARYVEQDRPVQEGDRVILDYSGSVNGVKFDGGSATDATLDIGSGTFIPGFEEQMVGMVQDEERDINVTFPDEYHAPELMGKDAVFAVKVKAIQKKELPELDDEFAQDVSEFDTLAALREDKRTSLEKRNTERAKNEMEDDAISKATENATFDVPEAMIQRQMDYMLQDISYRLQMSGMSLEDYCRYTGMQPEEMREGYHEESERRVRTQLVMDAIGKAEKLEASDEALEKELREYAERMGQEYDKFLETLTDGDREYFKERTVAQMTIDLVMDNAKLVDAPKEKKATPKKKAEAAGDGAEKKPAAKKAATKKPVEKAEAAAEEKPAKKTAAKKAEATGDGAEKKPAPKKKPAAKKAETPKE